ncbi:MAG: hypothetical protein K5678_09835 [Acetatifactor sp.]|nr:hypothetical protein [Acetatifactor sp.]
MDRNMERRMVKDLQTEVEEMQKELDDAVKTVHDQQRYIKELEEKLQLSK